MRSKRTRAARGRQGGRPGKVPAPRGAEGLGREGRARGPAQTGGSGADRHGSASLAAGQQWVLCQGERLRSCSTSARLPAAGAERPGSSSRSAASLITSFMASNKLSALQDESTFLLICCPRGSDGTRPVSLTEMPSPTVGVSTTGKDRNSIGAGAELPLAHRSRSEQPPCKIRTFYLYTHTHTHKYKIPYLLMPHTPQESWQLSALSTQPIAHRLPQEKSSQPRTDVYTGVQTHTQTHILKS